MCGRARARLFTHGHSASEVVLSGFLSASKARVLGYGIALTTAQATQEKRSRIENRRHHHELHTKQSHCSFNFLVIEL